MRLELLPLRVLIWAESYSTKDYYTRQKPPKIISPYASASADFISKGVFLVISALVSQAASSTSGF
jgi:hypothetical protein